MEAFARWWTAGRGKGIHSNGSSARNSKQTEDNLSVVEHDCSVNGSEVGSWACMDCEENEEVGERRKIGGVKELELVVIEMTVIRVRERESNRIRERDQNM